MVVNCTNTMVKTILNRNIQAAQRVMEGRRDQSTLAQSQEIHDLKGQLYLLEKRYRELEREVNDYREREQGLLSEIEELNEKLRYNTKPQLHSSAPYILGFDMGTEVTKGIAEKWKAFMYAYTDPVFVESDKPDLLLYDNGLAYTNPNGTVSLGFPVTQESLDRYGILSVRPLTDEELDDIVHKYNLIA